MLSLKVKVLAACNEPGASISGVALAHGPNTNLVRKWRSDRGVKLAGLTSKPPAVSVVSTRPVPAALPKTAAAPKAARRRPRRQALPDHLRRVEHRHEPENINCVTPECGQPMTRVGEDVSERLDIVPAEFFVHRHIYGKWACRCCQRQGIVVKIVFPNLAAEQRMVLTSIDHVWTDPHRLHHRCCCASKVVRGPLAIQANREDERVVVASVRERFAHLESHLPIADLLGHGLHRDMTLRYPGRVAPLGITREDMQLRSAKSERKTCQSTLVLLCSRGTNQTALSKSRSDHRAMSNSPMRPPVPRQVQSASASRPG